MNELASKIQQHIELSDINTEMLVNKIEIDLRHVGYEIVERNDKKPWGAYLRINGSQADMFIEQFFPGLSPVEARLGSGEAELSPKILIVSPEQRLSWQYHNRRAERWMFLTNGGYYKSTSNNEGELIIAEAGDVIQFAKMERHRLVAGELYTLVAEIWQHVNPEKMSDEEDIVRLSDDYVR